MFCPQGWHRLHRDLPGIGQTNALLRMPIS
jgi:hypothetical protein